MKHSNFFLALSALAVIGLSGCSDSKKSESPGSGKADGSLPVIQSSNYPLHYFAQRIGGEHVEAHYIVSLDGDPAFWKPADGDIREFQKADIILINGATYEKWLPTVSLPSKTQVDTAAEFAGNLIQIKAVGTHTHGDDSEVHAHAGTAFTTWIDFNQAKMQAKAVKKAILEKVSDEAAKTAIQANADALYSDLDALDAEMKAVTGKIWDRPLVGSHPIYQYAARAYGLLIKSVHWEPETVPSDDDMANLQKLLEAHEAKWMVWEGDPDPESVKKLEAIGVKSLVFDPSGNMSEPDWLATMKQISRT